MVSEWQREIIIGHSVKRRLLLVCFAEPHGSPSPDAGRVQAVALAEPAVGAGGLELRNPSRSFLRPRLNGITLDRYRGREIDTAGDSFLATFDGPARGIRCAHAITAGVRQLGIDVRAGLYTGECELMGGTVGGIAVHIGARVAAGAGEVLVSSTVKDLVAGSGIGFVDRGTHVLKGVPGEWRLFAATTQTGSG